MRNSILKSYLKKFIRSEAFISVIIVFVLAIGIIGTSYALYMDVDTDTNYQLVKVGDLSVGFDVPKDENGEPGTFKLKYLTPTDDDIATNKVESDIAKEVSQNNLFSFYIYNNGTYTANYDIKLVPQEGSISSEYLKYQICKDNSDNCKDIKTLSETTDNIIFNDELNPNSEDIYNKGGGSAYYFLRVWVSSEYADKVSENDKVVLKVEIEAKNVSGYLDNDNTLVGKLLSDDRVRINNDIPVFDTIGDYLKEKNKDTGEYEYILDSNGNKQEPGIYKAEDDYGISYYYRGAQSYNYVNFAGFTWRVVRINGDGSIRLILSNSLAKTCVEYNDDNTCKKYAGTSIKFNQNSHGDNAYVGYMYGEILARGTNNKCLKLNESGSIIDYITTYTTKEACETSGGKWTTNAYESAHVNIKDSTIKYYIDNFYKIYIENDRTNIHYEKYLADTLFCNDKSLARDGIGGYSNLGYNTQNTNYAAVERLVYSSGTIDIQNASPSLKCASGANNNFSRFTSKIDTSETLENGTSINNDLEYPIALLSADELVFAGAFNKLENKSYYLKYELDSQWQWTLTPRYFMGSSVSMFCIGRGSTNSLSASLANNENGVRPVINLKADVLYADGDGTSETPYEIKYN